MNGYQPFKMHRRRKPTRRRSHTKSRKGCATCKRRHIRCDEGFPQCRNCTINKKICPYNNTTQSKDQEDKTSPSPRLTSSLFDGISTMVVKENDPNSGLQATPNLKDFWNDDEPSRDPQQFGIADSFTSNMTNTKTHEKFTSTYIPISTDIFELFAFAMPPSTCCGPRIVSTLDDLNAYDPSQNVSQGLNLFYNNTGACGLLCAHGWCTCNTIRGN